MLSGCAFRTQLVTQGQRELFDYWLESAGQRPMPARSDLDPLKVPRLLPHLGLIDIREGVSRALFRLAGTRLRDIYGQEITGKRINEVFSGDCAAYWSRVHTRVAETGVPAHGRTGAALAIGDGQNVVRGVSVDGIRIDGAASPAIDTGTANWS